MNPLQDLELDAGGRPAANDDFVVLQDRASVLGLPALLSGQLPCVVSGCRLWQTGNQWNIGPGMVWDGTRLLPFTGRGNVSLPAMFAPGAVVVVDERAYQTGGMKTTIKEQSMDLVAVVAGAPNLVVDTWGCLRWQDVVRASVRYLGEIAPLATVGYVSTDYDQDGKGLPGTNAWGWHECNGLGGTDNLNGRVVLGRDTSKSDYDTVGKQGGAETVALTVAQLPAHDHGASSPNTDTNATGNGRAYKRVNEGGSDYGRRSGSTGSGQPHGNMQPFSTVLMRQWVGY